MKKWNCTPGTGTLGRMLWITALALVCSMGTMWGQVFKWAVAGGGPGWKQGNGIAVHNGRVFMVGKFSGPPPLPQPSNAVGISFGSLPEHELETIGISDAFIVSYHALSGTVEWVHQIKAGSASAVIAKSIAVVGNHLYVTGELEEDVCFDEAPRRDELDVISSSSFIARFTLTGISTNPLDVDWVEIAGPTMQNEGAVECTAVAVDAMENVYVCGTLRGNVTFPGTNSTLFPPQNRLFVYRIAGSTKSITTNTGTGDAYGAAIAILGNKAVVTGRYSGQINIPGPGLPSTTPPQTNILIARCDVAGNLEWAEGISAVQTPFMSTAGILSSAEGRSIAVDGNDIYVTGAFQGSFSFGMTPPAESDARDIFLLKYHRNDPLNWSRGWVKNGTIDATEDAFGNGVATYNGKVYATGSFSGTMTFKAPTPGSDVTLGSLGAHDIFAVCYNDLGELQWAQRAGNVYTEANRLHYDQGKGIAVDVDGYSYLVGEFGGDGSITDARFFRNPPIDLFSNHVRNVFTARISDTAKTVRGKVFVDGTGLSDHLVEVRDPSYSTNPSYLTWVTTGAGGLYTVYLPNNFLGDFTLQALRPFDRMQTSPTGGVPHTISPTTEVSADFYFIGTQPFSMDLGVRITVLSNENAVPGSTVCYRIDYENAGTINATDVLITLDPDDLLWPPWSTSTPLYVTTHTPNSTTPILVPGSNPPAWTITSLPTSNRGSIKICFGLEEVDPAVTQSCASEVTIAPGSTDPADNFRDNNWLGIIKDIVQPSDPNRKLVNPQGNISVVDVHNGMKLEYTVNFFNNGNSHANTVTLFDVLDTAFFPISAVTPMAAGPVSAVCPPPILIGIEQQLATFTLEHANLASIHESLSRSHGFTKFKLCPNTTLSIGMEIRNHVGIKFDLQPLIYTDTAKNCVVADFSVYDRCAGTPTHFRSREGGFDYLWNGQDTVRGITWDFGDSTLVALDTNPTHTYANPGDYTVKLTFHYSDSVRICDRYDSVHTVEKIVTIHPAPTPTIVLSGDSLVSSPGESYQWYYRNEAIKGATSRSYRPLRNEDIRDIRVRVRNSGGCEKISGIDAMTGDKTSESAVNIHPNPGPGRFTIDLGDPGNGANSEWKLTITDMLGTIVTERTIREGQQSCEIDLIGQPSGIYTARIEIDGKSATRKIVVKR